MSNLPIQFLDKVNSPELLAYLQQFGEKSYLSAEEINQIRDAINELAQGSLPDAVLKSGAIAINGLAVTIAANAFAWRINQQEFLTPGAYNVNLTAAADGFYRADIIVGTSTGTYQVVQGNPSATTAIEPNTPEGTIRLAGVVVFGMVVGQPTPTPTTSFIEKSERANVVLTGSGVINQLDLVDEKATIVFKGSITRLNTISYASVPYGGKRITLFNAQATPVTIGHSVSGYGVDFVFANGQDYVLAPNETIEFSFDITYAPYAHHRLIGSKGIATWSELQGKPTTFPPSAHTHTVSQITDFPTIPTVDQTIIDGSTNAVSGNAVLSQLDLKQNTLNWKTPQDYGAVGNGIADDTAAINACLSANSNVLLYGTYKISSTINIQSNQFIFSNNCTISSVATGFVFLKADNVNNWGISGKLKVTGSGYSDSTSKALNVIGGYNYSVNGMIISEIDGWGILVENGVSNGTRGQRGTFSNIYINNCWTGIETGLLQEFTTLESIKVTGCNYGCIFQGGNINLLNSNINDNINGVYIGDTVSTNNGHGIISNTNMNHNSGWNIKLSNVEYGQTIVGCHFYGTPTRNIEISDSYGISFDSCIIDGNVSNVDTHSPKGVHMISNSLIEPDTNFTGQKIYLRSCFTRTDSQYQTSLYDDGTKVGIGGTITPTANLEVIDVNQTVSGDGNVTIRTTDSQAADKGGFLTFGGSFSGTSRTVFGGISGRKTNSTANDIQGYLSLYYSKNGVGLVEGARLNSRGALLINKTDDDLTNQLQVAGTITASPAVSPNQVPTFGQVQAIAGRPYKVYTALLSQSGTNAPVATVLENTLGGTVVWSYVSIGQYRGTLTGAFLANKTVVFLTNVYGKYFLTGGRENDNSVMIGTQAPNGGSTNGDLSNSSIEIRVYL